LDRLCRQIRALDENGGQAAVVLELQGLRARMAWTRRVTRRTPVLVHRLAALEVRRILRGCGARGEAERREHGQTRRIYRESRTARHAQASLLRCFGHTP